MSDQPAVEKTWLDPPKTIREEPAGARQSSPDGLPSPLDERFSVVEPRGAGGQAVGYVVRGDDDRQYFLKIYQGTPKSIEKVWSALRRATGHHIVVPFETGVLDDGTAYELSEFVEGGNLGELLQRDGPLTIDRITEVVRQLTEALKEVHELGIRHRDVSPQNILVRRLDPLDTAITDFGISRRGDGDEALFTSVFGGRPHYLAPEAPEAISPDGDWWSLGMVIAELFLGTRLLRVDAARARWHVRTQPIDLSEISDAGIRLLCGGLLIRNPDDRWGAEQVRAWLDGVPPVLPGEPEPLRTPVRTIGFGGVDHADPASLAASLSRNWEAGVSWARANVDTLGDWLRQFPELEAHPPGRAATLADVRDGTAPRDVRHLRLIRWLNPFGKPYYRGVWVATAGLRQLAAQAAGSDPGIARNVVEDLWHHRLLHELDAAPGGSGLGETDDRWRAHEARWRALETRLGSDRGAARAFAALASETVRAELLVLACAGRGYHDDLRAQAHAAARELAGRQAPVPWFDELPSSGGDVGMLAALLLKAAALRDADELLGRWREYAAERRINAWAEWFDRNQRPTALAWAALAVLVTAIVAIVAMTIADYLNVSPAAIAAGWVASALAVLVIAATEVPLAAWIGVEYHPEHSLAYDLVAVGSFLAHPLRGNRWIALAGISGALTALAAGMAFAPPVLPVAATGAHLWRLRTRAARWRAASRPESAVEGRTR
ncbi:protein kinase domain-containing protein [Actinoallomurus acanthiterrae]